MMKTNMIMHSLMRGLFEKLIARYGVSKFAKIQAPKPLIKSRYRTIIEHRNLGSSLSTYRIEDFGTPFHIYKRAGFE